MITPNSFHEGRLIHRSVSIRGSYIGKVGLLGVGLTVPFEMFGVLTTSILLLRDYIRIPYLRPTPSTLNPEPSNPKP